MPHLEDLDHGLGSHLPSFGVPPLRYESVMKSHFFLWREERISRGVREVDNHKVSHNSNAAGDATLDNKYPFPTTRGGVVCDLGEAVGEDVGEGGNKGGYAVEDGDANSHEYLGNWISVRCRGASMP